MVRLFVEKGLDVNAVTRRGDTALHFAAGAGNVTMVKLLLAKGADVNAATHDSIPVRKGPIALNHLTALMYAAPYGTPDLVRTLIDAGAEVNAKDIRDMTPLMLSGYSETQNAEVVKLLLVKGADVKPKSVMGETALDWAKKFGNPEVIRLLQKAGAPASAEEHAALVGRIEAAYAQMIERGHAHGIRVIGATILPYVGSGYYHPGPESEADRQAINAWIRGVGHFDAVVDFDQVTRDPQHPDRPRP
jgi:ankyrin repeat protein